MKMMEEGLTLTSTPITRPKLYEIVAERLEQMILSGELKPGDPLPSERDVMSAYQVGRPAVREAFLALQNKGLIVTESGRRARVTAPSIERILVSLNATVQVLLNDDEDLQNVYNARVFVEKAMARHAARHITDAQLAELRMVLEENRKAVGNRQAFIDTDVQLHRLIFQTSDNPVFQSIYEVMTNWLMYRWSRIERNDQTESLAYDGHRSLVEAIASRNPDAAERRMQEHLTSSWTIWSRNTPKATPRA